MFPFNKHCIPKVVPIAWMKQRMMREEPIEKGPYELGQSYKAPRLARKYYLKEQDKRLELK